MFVPLRVGKGFFALLQANPLSFFPRILLNKYSFSRNEIWHLIIVFSPQTQKYCKIENETNILLMLLRVWVDLLALVYELSKPSGHTMMTFITVKIRVGGARERVSIAGGVDPRLFHTRHAHMLRDILKQEWTQCGAEWHRWGVRARQRMMLGLR